MSNHVELTLTRHGSIPGVGTFGTLNVNDSDYPVIEREWLDNQAFNSCIPTGRYNLVPYSSEKYPDVYALENTSLGVYISKGDIPRGEKGRYAILIHAANLPRQVQGCIAPGIERGYATVKGRTGLGVLKSRRALNQIMAALDGYEIRHINIQEAMLTW